MKLTRNNWIAVAVGAAVLAGFQNCTSSFMSAKPSSSVNLPFSHPDTQSTIQSGVAKGTIPMGDRDFLVSVFSDVFRSSDANITNFLNAIMYQELGEIQGMLGRPCEVNLDGSAAPCNYSFSNVETSMTATTSSIREAGRIQACRRLFANPSMLAVAVARVQPGAMSSPSPMGISAAIKLFYPASDAAQEVLGELIQLDQKMGAAAETPENRWRAIYLVLCESPTWQIL